LLLVLVASTRNVRLPLSNSARVMRTVSVLGGGAAFVLIVSVALLVTPPNEPLIVALVVALTAVVLTMKLAELAPAAIVTLAGTVATALLLASVTTVADGAAAFNVTVPWTEFPPTTELDDNVSADNASGAGVGVPGVTVTTRSRRPSWLLRILIRTFWVVVTFLAVALNLTDDAPAGMNTLEGTGRTVELLLESENEKPAVGATAPLTRLILISVEEPEAMVEGVAVISP
jgi:hypothetical protein